MRNLLIITVVFSFNFARAEVSANESELAHEMTRQLLHFAIQDKFDENRAKQQVAFFKKYFEFDLNDVGYTKFYNLNRWETAAPKARRGFINVASLVLSQFMVSHFTGLLDYVRLHDGKLAQQIVDDVKTNGTIKLADVSSDGQRKIRVTPLVRVLGDKAKEVEFVAVVKNNKIVDVIVGELQTSQKSSSSEATVRGLVMKTAVIHNGQIVTNVSEVEKRIREHGLEPIRAYMQYFLSRYIPQLQSRHRGVANLNLDSLLN